MVIMVAKRYFSNKVYLSIEMSFTKKYNIASLKSLNENVMKLPGTERVNA